MENKIHRTMVGGQAVIEGVMMRGVAKTAVAVRKPDGTIDLDVWETTSIRDRYPILGIPIVRGVVNFVEMLIFGYRTLMKSAEVAGLDAPATAESSSGNEAASVVEANAQEAASGSESDTSPVAETSTQEAASSLGNASSPAAEASAEGAASSDGSSGGGALTAGIGILSTIVGVIIAIVLFVIAPTVLVSKTNSVVHWGIFKTLVEGVIKIAIFVAYLAIVSCMKDIQRVYQYHGAEHKTIYCYEHGDELTPENARKYTRFHPRCGTSFLLIVLIVSIIVFSVVTWKVLWLRIVLKLVLLPVVVGISYEIIKFAGRHDNSVMRFILAPGLWLQRLTTREPDLSQLEVAITSIKAVLTDNPEDDRW